MAERQDPLSKGRGEPREIRAELDRTRASLDRAFDALGSKLTPASLFWDGMGVFRSGASAGVSRAVQMAQQHPLPACVIGVGVGWLLLENARAGRGDGAYPSLPEEHGGYATGGPGAYPYPGTLADREGSYGAGQGTSGVRAAADKAAEVAGQAGERVAQTADAVKEKTTRAAEAARDQAARAAEAVKDRTRQAAETVRDQASQTVSAVREQASHTAEAVRDQASRVGAQARQTAQRASSEFDRLLREQPMAVGLGALAIGMLAGLLIPATRREDEMLGEARDRKLEKARDTARETLEKGKQVARATVETAVETAKETARTEAERQQILPRGMAEKMAGGGQHPSPGPEAGPVPSAG